ncbi:MAG: ATP-binding protein [Bacillota bacterium]|nr:ATP-binding protein [Bacillota bacterium]
MKQSRFEPDQNFIDFYKRSFEDAPYAMVLIQMIFEGEKAVDYLYIYANPACADVLDLPCRDFIGMKYSECFPGSTDQNIELYSRAVKENESGKRSVFSLEIDRYIDIAYSKVGEDMCMVMAYQSVYGASDAEQTLAASMSAFDMIISVNLTKNQYHMINYHNFHNTKAREYGNFDELIRVGLSTVPDKWKGPFNDAFARDNQLEAFAKGVKTIVLDHQQYSNDGSLHWVRTQVIRIEDTLGNDVLQVTTAKLIDDLKDVEQQLLRERRAVYDTIPGSVTRCRIGNEKLFFLEWDNQLEDIMGLTSEGEKSPMDSVLDEDVEHIRSLILEKGKAGLPISFRHRMIDKEGDIRWIHSEGRKVSETDGMSDYIFVSFDITGEKEATEQLDTERKRYKELLDSISCGYLEYYTNDDNTLTYREFNQEACVITGKPKELLYQEKIPRELSEIEEDSVYWKSILKQAEENLGKRIDYICRIRNGVSGAKYIWVAGYVTCLRDEDGRLYIQDVFMNVDAQRKYEMELVVKNEALRIALSKMETTYFYYYPKEDRLLMGDNSYEIEGIWESGHERPEEWVDTFVAEEFRPKAKEAFERVKTGEENLSFDFRLADRDRWVKTDMAVIEWDELGMPSLVIGFSDDITEEKNRDAETQETLAGISNSFDYIHRVHIPSMTVTAIKQTRSLEETMNRQGTIGSVVKKIVTTYIPEEDKEIYQNFMNYKRIAKALNWDHTTETLDIKMMIQGEERWVRINVILASMKNQEVESYIVALRDITEEKEAEFAAQQTTRERNQLIYAISVIFQSMFIIDLKNGQYRTIKKFNTQEDAIGMEGAFIDIINAYSLYMEEEHADLFKDTFRLDHIVESVSEDKPILAIELPLEFEGRQYWLRYNAVLTSTEDGQSKTIAFTTLNVTPEREKEARHQEALQIAFEAAQKANNAKSEFLSRVSHDIRTPMNVIMGMTAIAKGQTGDEERIADCLEKIDLSSRHLLELINEILDMSRIEAGHLKPTDESFDLSDTIGEILTMFRPLTSNKGQTLNVEIGALKHSAVTGDEKLVKQALINFMSNAVKYTPQEGNIRFAVSEKSSDRLGFSRYEFVFEDDGLGMRPEFVEHIFEPFSREEDSRTSKIQGTGLGMTIAYNIIKMMDGNIEVESAPGKGSKFTVTFYLARQEEGGAATDTQGKSYDRDLENKVADLREDNYGGKKFLLAEDNLLNREIISELLSATGAQVDTVENGQDALELFKEMGEGYYDLVVLDIQMPVMDGYKAAAAIRSLEGRGDAATVPIFAMTANAFADDIKQAKEAGMNEHIAKPLDIKRMRDAMRKWLK